MADNGVKRIAVIGAGIVGVSTALFLQRDGHDVTLIDPLDPGAGTSSGNAGVISLSTVVPIATPGVLRRVPQMLLDGSSNLRLRWPYLPRLLPWLVRFVLASRPAKVEESARLTRALADRAWQAHEILIQQCGAGELVSDRGWLKVARDAQAFERLTAYERGFLDRYEVPYTLLERNDVHDLEPALAADVTKGMWLHLNRVVRQPQRYTERLAATFFERGGRHLKTEARGIRCDGAKADGVITQDGVVEAEAVVVAAGAFSKRFAKEGGHRIPLEAERGYHVMLPQPEATLSRPVLAIEHGFVMAPMEDGVRITSGVELASNDAPPDHGWLRRLVPEAQRLLPGLSNEVRSEWRGHRPSTPDSLPVIGPTRRMPNLYLAFGHQHIGLTLGPLTGRIIADLIARRDPGLDLAPFRPDRRYF